MLVFSARNASIEPKYCRCAGRTFSTSATVGAHELRQRFDFARMVGADLQHRRRRVARRSRERQRYAPEVVQAARRLRATERRIEKRTNGGFAAAAGDRKDRTGEARARRAAQRPKAVERIRHAQLRQPGAARTMGQRTDRATSLRIVDEHVTVAVGSTVGVEARTRITQQRHEQIAFAQRPRIDADSGNVRAVDRRHAYRDARVAPTPNDFTEVPIHRRYTTLPQRRKHSVYDIASDDARRVLRRSPFHFAVDSRDNRGLLALVKQMAEQFDPAFVRAASVAASPQRAYS